MLFTLPLEDMSLQDKLMAIEAIWDDICRRTPEFPSPVWHEDVLKERDRKMESGIDKLMSWEYAKQQLHNRAK